MMHSGRNIDKGVLAKTFLGKTGYVLGKVLAVLFVVVTLATVVRVNARGDVYDMQVTTFSIKSGVMGNGEIVKMP